MDNTGCSDSAFCPKARMGGLLTAAVRYRHFVTSSVRAEFANRYARSRLGAMWMVLNPLAQAAVIAFALSGILSARLPGVQHPAGYAFYLMAGILVWSLFQDTVTRCLTLFTDNAQLLKKLMFPRICLPLVVSGITGVSSGLLLVATSAIFLLMGHPLSPMAFLAVPLVLAITLMLAIGLGLILGVINVFVRDVGQVVPIVLQFLFWLTPIVYLPDVLPATAQSLLAWNPVQVLVVALHDLMVFDRRPDWAALAAVALASGALLVVALRLFRRASPEMVDVLWASP